jgi:hypothetical protein
MTYSLTYRSRGAALVTLALLVLPMAGCSDLLEATDPDLINPGDVRSPEGAAALRVGALNRFKNITGGTESTWLFGGLLADEWSTSSTFVQNDETDQRRIQTNNSSVTGMYRNINRVRTATNQAIAALEEFLPTRTADIAEMYFARGFAEMQLAQDFCNGIPLSDGSVEEPVFGTPLTGAEVFQRAIASYDTALAVADTFAAALTIRRAASVGKARALLGLGQYAAAGALVPVSAVPTSFAYNHTFALTSGTNTIWAQAASSRRYTVGDSLEGNARDLLVLNAIPFFSARDPRLPVTYTVATNGDTTKSQDGFTFSRTTTLYGQLTPLPVVNGIDARLVEAEAALAAGDTTGMLAILNALRAAPPLLGTVQPPVMTPLTDPGTAAGRVNLLFREKAFWTFSRGQRLGDLRRLIRQYGRTPATTFPVGTHYKGGDYGTDVNLPVPQEEQANPNFTACLDRNG